MTALSSTGIQPVMLSFLGSTCMVPSNSCVRKKNFRIWIRWHSFRQTHERLFPNPRRLVLAFQSNGSGPGHACLARLVSRRHVADEKHAGALHAAIAARTVKEWFKVIKAAFADAARVQVGCGRICVWWRCCAGLGASTLPLMP